MSSTLHRVSITLPPGVVRKLDAAASTPDYRTRSALAAKVDGLIDPKPVTPVNGRSWNYVSLGHGNSYRSWLAIVTALKEVGYDYVVSIENEDYSLDADTAISTSTLVLKFCIQALNSRGAQ